VEEIHIVGHAYRRHDPEKGVSVKARERFSIFFLLTWREIENEEFRFYFKRDPTTGPKKLDS